MPYRVIFRVEAQHDAIDAVLYLREHASPAVARAWHAGLVDAIRSLESLPKRGAPAREHRLFPDHDLRQLIYKSHRIIYTVVGQDVHVLHIRHGRQDALRSLHSLPDG